MRYFELGSVIGSVKARDADQSVLTTLGESTIYLL